MGIAPKVLLVDDEPLSLSALRQYLDGAGYQVVTAGDGQQAWDYLTTLPNIDVQAVVLDWVMPKMNGIELLQKMQGNAKLSQLPVIMLTGVDEKEDIIEAVQAGVFDYLIKPVDKELLLAMLDRALAEFKRV